MKIFITGLCLQGNKGGPALAISLMSQLRKIFPEARFVMSVPSAEFSFEVQWADKAGTAVVSDFSHLDLIAYLFHLPVRFKKVRVTNWLIELKAAELVVDLSGVSYVGPPAGTTKRVLLNGRFKYFLFSRIFGKPFLAWTQSYGPFSNALIRYVAKKDLSALPVIMCRGESGKAAVEQLLPRKAVQSYPDVAITLDYTLERGREMIVDAGIMSDLLVTVSPSAVLYSKSGDREGLNRHVSDMIWLCKYLVSSGYRVLLVPHTFRSENHDPLKCDYAVSREVYEGCGAITEKVSLVEGDNSAVELKSIIANAKVHVGARYHSLVAALSSGVPAIALSWHVKYQDVLAQFGVGKYVVPLSNGREFRSRMENLLRELANEYDEVASMLVRRQKELVAEVDRNRNQFLDSYKQITK